jgi:dTDP-4-dehydrorhamnose reductase
MKKILILGCKGMAGHMLYRNLPNLGEYDVYGAARNVGADPRIFNLDVSDVHKLEKIISENSFDVVVNCIGILNKDAEDHPEKAVWFNSYFPHLLAKITESTGTKVIHISTDCVFSGRRGNYTEEDSKDGVGFYAQSKALGEIANSKDITIRTSIIGPELNKNGIGLFNWFMMQPDNAILNGYVHAYWSGITTLELSHVIHDVLQNEVTGLKQIAPSEKISKYDLLKLFNEIYKDNSHAISSYEDYSVDKSLCSTRKDYQYQTPDYKQMLLDMKDWIIKNKDLYPY